jgi:hypothetical protein
MTAPMTQSPICNSAAVSGSDRCFVRGLGPREVAATPRPASRRVAREHRSQLCRSMTRTRPAERPKPRPLSGRGVRVPVSVLGRISFLGGAVRAELGDLLFDLVDAGNVALRTRVQGLEFVFEGFDFFSGFNFHFSVFGLSEAHPLNRSSFAHCPNSARTIFAHCPIYFSSPNAEASRDEGGAKS